MIPDAVDLVIYFEAEDRGGVSNTISNIVGNIGRNRTILVVGRKSGRILQWREELAGTGALFSTDALRNRQDLLGWFDVPGLVRLSRIFRRARLVNFHLHTPFSCLPAIFLAAFCGKAKIVTTEQYITQLKFVRRRKRNFLVSLVREMRLSLLMAVKSASFRVIDVVVNVSNANREFLLGQFPSADPARVEMIWNGIVVANYDVKPGGPAPVSHPALAAGRAKVVAVIASLGNQKGHVYLIEAIPGIAERVKDVLFLFVGDGHMRSRFEELTRANGSDRHVVFTGFRSDIPRILAFSDLFVLPSLFEGTPLAILEAMAAGKAVVATRADGNAEAVVHGETGFLVEPKDPAGLAARIVELLTDDALRERFGRNGRTRVEQCFSARGMAERYAELFDRLLGPGPVR